MDQQIKVPSEEEKKMQATVMSAATMSPELEIPAKTITAAPVEFHVMREPAQWNLATRIGFRFVFAYFVLYSFPAPLDILPLPSVYSKYEALWTVIVTWVGKHLLGLNITVLPPNGSGDRTYDYVQILCMFALAVAATLLWSLLDARRSNYEKLHQWLRLYIRIVLGMAMITYGSIKVIQSQMPPPFLSTLTETYGQSSPMNLLWTFMGASRGYNAFAGGIEMLAGVLLFIPAFTAIGALVSVAAMSNVFVLNMCYDVPVKQFSFHLLLMGVFLLAPDMRRLADLFFFHRTVELYSGPVLFQRKWVRRCVVAAQLVLGLYVGTMCLQQAKATQKMFATHIGPALYGVWSVDEYAIDGKAMPPSPTDKGRWQRVFLEYSWRMVGEDSGGTRRRYSLTLDEKKQTMKLVQLNDPNWKADLTYQTAQNNVLTLSGHAQGRQVDIRLHRTDTANSFPLTSRGFHWINEHPFNQ